MSTGLSIEVDMSTLQREVHAWAENVFPERTLTSVLAHLREEVGELTEAVSRLDPPPLDTEEAELAEECADVGILLLSIASLLGEDLATLMAVKHALNTGRRRTGMGQRG